jgi:hypothetical protein
MQRRAGTPPTDGTSKLANAKPEHDDAREGAWSRQRRIDMDRKFRECFERAMKRERKNDRR